MGDVHIHRAEVVHASTSNANPAFGLARRTIDGRSGRVQHRHAMERTGSAPAFAGYAARRNIERGRKHSTYHPHPTLATEAGWPYRLWSEDFDRNPLLLLPWYSGRSAVHHSGDGSNHDQKCGRRQDGTDGDTVER